jgi:hypothetical protein
MREGSGVALWNPGIFEEEEEIFSPKGRIGQG